MTLHCGQWHCIWSSPLQCPPVPLQPHSGLRAARAASDMTHCQCISSVNCHRHHRGLRTAAWLGNACEDRCRTAKYLSVFSTYSCIYNLFTQLDLLSSLTAPSVLLHAVATARLHNSSGGSYSDLQKGSALRALLLSCTSQAHHD